MRSALIAVMSSMHSDEDLDPTAYAALLGIFYQPRLGQSMHHVPLKAPSLQPLSSAPVQLDA